MGTGGSFLRDKEAGGEADHSTPSRAEFKKGCSYTIILQTLMLN
jgi:hypothetical protein